MQRSQKVNAINILSGVTQEPPHIHILLLMMPDAHHCFHWQQERGFCCCCMDSDFIQNEPHQLPVFLQQAYQQAVPHNNNWANEPVSCSMYFCPLCWVFCLSSRCFQPLFASNGLSNTGDRQSKTWKKYCLTTSVIANEAWLYEPKTNFTVMMDFYRFTDMMYVPTCRCSLHGNSK